MSTVEPRLEKWVLLHRQDNTCPKCGASTEYEEIPNPKGPLQEHHWCRCGYEFLREFTK